MTLLPRRCIALCLGLLFTSAQAYNPPTPPPVPDNPAAPPPAATWQHQQFTFNYMGFTTHYSCDGLRAKLRQVLQALGARKDDLKVTPAGCTRMSGQPELTPSLDIDMWTLQAAPEPPAADAVKTQWRAVQLGGQLGGGDCELADEIENQLLSHFTVRYLQIQTGCIPHQAVASIRLSLEVLGPAR